jgi:hypothetical protein
MSHPSQIVTDAVAAIERQDWNAFTDLCDPVSVRRFKNDLVWQFSDHGDSSPITVEQLLDDSPQMPREVAEYNVDEMERYRDPALRLSLEIPTVSSVEELNGLEPTEVLIRWLKSRMPWREEEFSIRQWEPSEGLEVTEVRRLSQEEIDNDVIYKPAYVVLGSVRDGDEFAHVISRRADRSPGDDEPADEDYATPADEAELDRTIRNRIHMLTALCRRQADSTWRLVAERNLFFLPQMSIAT